MKKIFLFLAVAGSAFMTSCSDDDSSTETTPVATSIALTSDVQTADLGSNFTMTVMNNLGVNVTSTSTFYVDDAAIASNVFTPTEAGTYVLHATNGTLVSGDVTITVTTPATAIVLTSDETTMELGSGDFTMTVMNDLDVDVTATSTYFVDGVAIESNVFSPTAVGTYVLSATNGSLVSNDVTVTVTPATPAMNSIFYAGANNPVNNAAVVLWGGYNPDPNATTATHTIWSSIVFVGTTGADIADSANYLDIEFIVPLNSDGTMALPTTSNVTYLDIYEMKINGADIDVTAQTTAGNLAFAANLDPAATSIAFTLTNAMIGTNALSIDYNGALLGVFNESGNKSAYSADSAAVFAAHNKMSKTEVTQKVKSFIASKR